MLSFTLLFSKKKTIPAPEDELFQNAFELGNGILAFRKTWVNQAVSRPVYALDELVIEEGAEINGDLYCRRCTVNGKVNGNIHVWELLVIREHAVIRGNITARRLEATGGAVINSNISMGPVTRPDFLADLRPHNLVKVVPAPAAAPQAETADRDVKINVQTRVFEPAPMEPAPPIAAHTAREPHLADPPPPQVTRKEPSPPAAPPPADDNSGWW